MRFSAAIVPALRACLSGEDSPPWPELADSEVARLIAALDYHGALGLVHARARAGAEMPRPLADAAARAAMALGAHGAALIAELHELCGAFAERRIAMIVLKGPALALTVYHGVSERPFGDLDLLVDDEDMQPAGRLLEELGYQRAPEEAPDFAHHWSFGRTGAGGLTLTVELHRRLLKSAPFDRALPTARLFADARPLDVMGNSALMLGPEDMVLHASAHLVLQHARSERLIWVADIDRILRVDFGDDEERWRSLADRAVETGLGPAVGDSVAAARLWFATPVRRDWAPPEPTTDAAAAHERLRRRAPVGREGARLLTDVRGVAGRRGKIAFALAHLLPSPDYMRGWYGIDRTWKLPIYYGLRAVRGLGHIIGAGHEADDLRTMAAESPAQWMIARDNPTSPGDEER